MNSMTIGCKINSSRFEYLKDTKELFADISELSHAGVNPLGRLYADAADTGFVLVSNITGKEVEFCLVNESKDSEGEIRFWRFEPVPTEFLSNDRLKGTHVIILND